MVREWLPTVLFGLVLAVVVSGLVVSVVADRRRRERLLVWSAERRWDWRGDDDRLVDLLPGEPFGRGTRRRVSNVVSGVWDGREALGFDYRYTVRSGSGRNRRSRTYRYALAVVRLPAVLPRVHVGPENTFHRVVQAFGVDDIEVESHEFNRRFTVEADDRKGAFAILHPRLVETLTHAQPVEWRTDLSVLGPVVLSWWRGSLEAVELQHRLILLGAVVDSVPDYVWREAGWEPGGPAPRT